MRVSAAHAWPARVAIAEGARNAIARLGRSAWLTMILAVLIASPGIGEAVTLSGAADAARLIREAGGDVYVAASGEEPLSASECDQLGSLDSVARSGWLRHRSTLEIGVTPSVSYEAVEVSDDLPTIWGAKVGAVTDTQDQILIGETVAADFGVSSGDVINLSGHGLVQIRGLVTDTLRFEGASRWIMISQAPDGGADECWVEFHPGFSTVGIDVVRSVLVTPAPREVAPLVQLDELSQDPDKAASSRPSRQMWVWSGLSIAIILWFTALLRRGDWALYRLHGANDLVVMIVFGAETAALVLIALMIAMVAVFTAATIIPLPHSDIYIPYVTKACLSAAATGFGMGILGAGVRPRRDIISELKEG